MMVIKRKSPLKEYSFQQMDATIIPPPIKPVMKRSVRLLTDYFVLLKILRALRQYLSHIIPHFPW